MALHSNLEHRIRTRAHQIWEQSGRLDGRAEEHWWLAERELTSVSPAELSTEPRAAESAVGTSKRKAAKAAAQPRKTKAASTAN